MPISKKTLKIKSVSLLRSSQRGCSFTVKPWHISPLKYNVHMSNRSHMLCHGPASPRVGMLYAISLARVLVRRIVKAKSRVINENRQVPQLETRIFSSQVQICWIAEWLNASTSKCCWVFEIVNCWRGARAAEASLSVARGRIFSKLSLLVYLQLCR